MIGTTSMSQKFTEENIDALLVMAVDDEDLMLKMIDFSLKAIGIHKIVTASDGVEALSIMSSLPKKVDLIICDWDMPKMNGLDFLKKIRAQNDDTSFIMLTGNVTRESVSAAVQAGANSYVAKPFTVDQLKAKILSLGKK
jgi:two-component system chemotaxis response regulator CheY